MADLIAQGPRPDQRWRRALPDPITRETVSLGRSSAQWTAPWDAQISRMHVRLTPLADDRVSIERSAAASNPVYYQGREIDRATLVPGEHFVIGTTTFTLARRPTASRSAAQESVSGQADRIDEQTFDVAAVRRETFHDAAGRLDVLTRLPDLIAGSHSQDELLVRLTGVLLQAIPDSVTVAFVRLATRDPDSADPDSRSGESAGDVEVLYGDQRPASTRATDLASEGPSTHEFLISRRLVRRAMSTSMAVLHRWNRSPDSVSDDSSAGRDELFTAAEQMDWAMAVPIQPDAACQGWIVYVSGTEDSTHSQHEDSSGEPFPHRVASSKRRRRDDVKFVELIAGTIGNLLLSRRLQKRQIAMRQFFSPVVLSAIASEDSDSVLSPCRADLSVLFCDLRGFSEASLRQANDLLGLLSDVSRALSVMTGHILDADGVIGDFHGDAAMGFWGWPIPQSGSAMAALRTAMAIRESFHREQFGFQCGIGIASGPGVAGGIGSDDQIKVTAFGPVVNLASRLESMTKTVGAEIILDQESHRQIVASDGHRDDLGGRFADLGPVSIKGWENPETVFRWIPDPEHG